MIAIALGPNTAIGNVALAACIPNGTGNIDCDPGTVETVAGVRVAGGTSTSIVGADLKITGYVGFGTGGAWRGSNYDILIDQNTVSSDALFLNMGWANSIDFTVSNSTLNFKLLGPRGGTSLNFWRAGSNNTFLFDNVAMNNNFGATIFESGPEGPVVNNNYYVNDVVINGQSDIGWLISGAGGEAIFDGLIQPDSVRAGIVAYSSGTRRLLVHNSLLGGENNLGAVRWHVDANATDPISTVQIENTTFVGEYKSGVGFDELHIVGRSNIQNAVLDGGEDVSAAGSFTDTLVFQGMQADLNTANVRNWESATVDNCLLPLTGDSPGVGGVAADGLSVIGGSVIDAPKLRKRLQ